MPQASPQDLKDLPQTLVGPSAWLGKDMAANPDAWLYSLSVEDIKDLENAFDEIELLGFPLCHPFLLLKDSLPEKQIILIILILIRT